MPYIQKYFFLIYSNHPTKVFYDTQQQNLKDQIKKLARVFIPYVKKNCPHQNKLQKK